MNTFNEPRASSIDARYLLAADCIHLLLAALVLDRMLFVGTEVTLLFQLAITLLIMIVIVRGGSWLALGAIQISLFFYESRVDEFSISLDAIVQSIVYLALIMYAAGFRSIRRWLREWLALVIQISLTPNDQRTTLTAVEDRESQTRDMLQLREQSSRLLLRFARVILIVVVTAVAFMQLPFTVPGVHLWWRRAVDLDYVLWPGPTVFALAIAALAALAIGSWKSLNGLQARLYLKTLYMRYHFRELRSILIRTNRLVRPVTSPVNPVNSATPTAAGGKK